MGDNYLLIQNEFSLLVVQERADMLVPTLLHHGASIQSLHVTSRHFKLPVDEK